MPNTDQGNQDSPQDPSIYTKFLLKVLIGGAVVIGAGMAGAEGRKLIIPDHEEAKEALRSVLKDPEKTTKLIEAMTKDQVIDDELISDPHVMKNYVRLTNAIDRDLLPKLDKKLKDLKAKKTMLEETKKESLTSEKPGNKWTEDVVGPVDKNESAGDRLNPELWPRKGPGSFFGY
jgi:hypothetical protein